VTAVSIDEALEQILAVLAHDPAGLFADFDGTLSPIAPVPEAAYLHPQAREVLPILKDQVPLFAVITGRSTENAIEKIGLTDLLYVGNHGLEWNDHGVYRAHPAGEAAASHISAALAEIAQDLTDAGIDQTGMVYENKRLSASIHYRVATDPEATERILTPVAEQRAAEHGLQMTSGKMMVELRPTASVSKGSAVEEIVRERGLKAAIFLGDDITDVDAFRTIRTLREHGTIEAGLAVGVLSDDTKPEVIAASDILVGNVEEVANLLTRLSERLTADGATA